MPFLFVDTVLTSVNSSHKICVMHRLIIILIASLFFSTQTKAKEPTVLITAEWLNDNMSNPEFVLLQVNFLRYDYEKEHIKGARLLWPNWLAADSPEGNFNPPDAKEATKVLQQLGVNKNSRVILYHTKGEVTVTARMFVTLEYLGLAGRVHYLNGGLEAWKKAGYPVTSELPVVKKGNFVASINKVLVDKDYVLTSLQSPSAVVVDARMKRFYDGEPTGNPRDGHITGSKNIPYPDLLDSTFKFKSISELNGYFQPVVSDKKTEVVTYCFIGQTASVLYMAGRLLGYNMKIYDGSMQEWSRLEYLPMEKTKKD
jgi:thiosulfate/3-mercaptopyruvate sulfurtransferase